MRWVIQKNLQSEERDYQIFKTVCEKHKIDFLGVKVIPFASGLPEGLILQTDDVYYGSVSFTDALLPYAPKGLFFNDNFSMENYNKRYGIHMLNYEGEITSFNKFSKNVYDPNEKFFVRPDDDCKRFAGEVMTFEAIQNWNTRLQKFDNFKLDGDTKILVGPAYNVKKEWRNYVVDGKIVTSSLYRKDFHLSKSATDIPEEMIDFSEKMLNIYQPHPNFALDVCICGDSYYIVECGCLNGVGLYHADVEKLILAVTKWMEK
jgi:hypothetical protein